MPQTIYLTQSPSIRKAGQAQITVHGVEASAAGPLSRKAGRFAKVTFASGAVVMMGDTHAIWLKHQDVLGAEQYDNCEKAVIEHGRVSCEVEVEYVNAGGGSVAAVAAAL